MAFRRSDALPSYESSDEIFPTPSLPKQKVISSSFPNISEISDIDYEENGDLVSTISNNANACQSTSKFSQSQSAPLNVVALTNRTIPRQMTDPILPQQIIGPASGQPHCTSFMEVDKSSKLELCADLSAPVFSECLKRQEEKVNLLQEQISKILELMTVPCQSTPKLTLVPNHEMHNQSELVVSQQNILKETSISPPQNSFGGEYKDNSQLLLYLQAQSEQFQKLQEINQILQENNQTLLAQNIKLLEEKQKLHEWNQELKYKLLLKNDRRSLNKLADKAGLTLSRERPLVDNETTSVSSEEKHEHNSSNTACQQQTKAKRIYQSTKPKSNDIENVEFCEEKEIEKTSTSTMTSLIYDGSDKVVYQKLTTVTTDYKKQCNEISTQCSSSKEPMSTPENRPSLKDAGTSSRKKKGKCRKCGIRSPSEGTKDAHPNLDASKNRCRKVQQTSPESKRETRRNALQYCEEKMEEHKADPDRIISPRYENILKNVNELNLNCNEVETTPRVRTYSKPSSKQRKRCPLSPRSVDLSPTTENRRRSNRRKSSPTTSNTDSASTSPNCSIQEVPLEERESDARQPVTPSISMYGLPAKDLSKETRSYLENFGLVRDRNNDNFRRGRTTLVKRYLR